MDDTKDILRDVAKLDRAETTRRRATRYSEIAPNLQFAEYISGDLPAETQLFSERLK